MNVVRSRQKRKYGEVEKEAKAYGYMLGMTDEMTVSVRESL